MEKEIRKEFQVSDEAVLRYDKAFADRLKNMRDRNGLKRDWVAEQLGVHYNTLKNWELGKSHPGTREIIVLSKIYHVTLDEFFKGLA
ncbi:MAG: helix-turn-helix transcriptional regulator [Actinobacteria bacterium]|nr:helix-turn-helix transcriptional regulator [Actinomycetota bacterium]